MNKYNKLANNTIIFFVGNFGSKIISFLMVRYYTSVFTTAEYGIIDVLVATANFIIPLATIGINESVFRFSMDTKIKSNAVIEVGFIITMIGSGVLFIIAMFIPNTIQYSGYKLFVCCFCFSSGLCNIISSYCRGIGYSKTYAFSGILHSALQIAMVLIFVSAIKGGIIGYFIAMTTVNILVSLFIVLIIRNNIFPISSISLSLIKQMLIYAIPLIANTICWWVMGSLDRYVILSQLTPSDNGLYSAASKIPTLLAVISSVFFSAWQISAVAEAESEDKDNFYNNVFTFLHITLVISASILLLFIKPIYWVLVGEDFKGCWVYSPFLIIAMIFSCYASFLGTNYTVTKKTSGALVTSMIASSVNLVLNILFTRWIGLTGTALATMISYVVLWGCRAYHTRKFVHIKLNWYKFSFSIILIIAQAVSIVMDFFSLMVGFICILFIIFLFKKDILVICDRIKGMIQMRFAKRK